jgi:hypothetical protein
MAATALNRGATWTNPDGLVVGSGRNRAVTEGRGQKTYGGVKSAALYFSFDNMASANIPVPAGARVLSVQLKVLDAWVGGTSLTVGDGSTTNGFVTATEAATANLTAGAQIIGQGVYTYDDTADGDVTAAELKEYTTADTVDIAAQGTFTAGSAVCTVVYC